MSDFDLVLGTPKAQRKNDGYGVVIEKYPNHPVLTLHAVDNSKERTVLRMSLNTQAQNMLGLIGKQFEKSDAVPFEKVFFGTLRKDGEPFGIAIVNFTHVNDERGIKFNKNGSFANKEMYESIHKMWGTDSSQDVEFLLHENDVVTASMPSLIIHEVLNIEANDDAEAEHAEAPEYEEANV